MLINFENLNLFVKEDETKQLPTNLDSLIFLSVKNFYSFFENDQLKIEYDQKYRNDKETTEAEILKIKDECDEKIKDIISGA